MHFTELRGLYDLPFFGLLKRARTVHEENWPEREVQLSTLLSIKTGGCSEDCGYCAQSSRYSTGLQRESLIGQGDRDGASPGGALLHGSGVKRCENDRLRTDRDSEGEGAPECGPLFPQQGSAGDVLLRRGELNFLWRQTAHDGQPAGE